MKKLIYLNIIVLLTLAFLLSGCGISNDSGSAGSASNASVETNKDNGKAGEEALYKKITSEEAKSIMDQNDNYILLDARTQSEYKEGHIKGAILMPETEIGARAEKELPDKNQTILIYCRSGRRSKIAADILVGKGYSKVYDFGGIIDWPYETVKPA